MLAETLTFLFTDIEGSTALFERVGEIFTQSLELHHRILRREVEAHGGRMVRNTGDGVIACFDKVHSAIFSAVAAQQALWSGTWAPETGPPRVRMGIHRGPVEFHEGDFRGLTMHHAARVMSAAHGMQILCSLAVKELLDAERINARDLGLFRLKGIQQPVRLFEVVHGKEYPEFPPLNVPAAFVPFLPTPPTEYYGREAEIEELAELLAPPNAGELRRNGGRLLTLLGPGGTGKTRLALEVARRLLAPYLNAVWFVSLAELRDPELILDRLRETLGLTAEPQRTTLSQIAEYLGPQPCLFVLDNLEQLLPGAAEIVSELLTAIPTVACLVTSRLRVNLSAEQGYPVVPLPSPSLESSAEELLATAAARLFLGRARAVRRDFAVSASNAADIARLIRALEGIPLAIELAAARVGILTPRQILQRMNHRLELLAGGPRDAPMRHRALRATIDWSYNLLPESLQQIFARLSVFRGGWTLEAAEAVAASDDCPAGRVLDALSELQAHSLIYADETGGAMRYRMLEVIRECAEEHRECLKLADAEEAHARYFFQFCGRADNEDSVTWHSRLRPDEDNVRSFLSGSAPASMRLRGAIWLYPYWLNRGTLLEGIRCLDGLRSVADEAPRETQAAAANALAILTWKTGNYDRAQRLFEEALTFWEEHGPVTNVAGILNNLGIVAADRGDFGQAQQFYGRSVEIYRQAGPAGLLATSLSNSGVNAMRLNDLSRASELLHEARTLLGTGADWPLLANTMLNLAELYTRLGEHNKARKSFAESMEIRHRLDTHENRHLCWFVLGEIARSEGQLPLAVTCWSAAVHAMEGSEEQPSPSSVADLESRLSSARGELNSEAYQRAATCGQYLHLDGVISPQGDWLDPALPSPI